MRQHEGTGLEVAAVELGIRTLLLDDEDVDTQPQDRVERRGIHLGHVGGFDRGL
jgi:hypothetical protein